MKAVDPKIVQEIDRRTMEDFLFPRLILMENAGREVAKESIIFFKPKKIILFCGGGFNAGDGLVAARYLFEYAQKITVILTSQEDRLKSETKTNLEILKKLGVKIINLTEFENFQNFILKEKSDLIIDAMIGIGLKSQIEGFLKEVIEEINKKKTKVVSIDIPSGLSAQTGDICGVSIKAELTVTFTFPKKGMYIGHGPEYCGKIKVVNIGIPQKIIKEVL